MAKFELNSGRASPGIDAQVVTPDDSNDLPNGPCRGIRIGTAGDVAIITLANTTVTLKNCQGGATEPIGARRILNTGTTALNILAIY